MRPWYMPMMTPYGDEAFEQSAVSTGMNVYEKDGYICVEAPIPGIPADKVDVTYTDGRLHISAKHEDKEEEKVKKQVVYKMERESSFEYIADVPTPIDDKSIEAEIRDGVIFVKARIAEAAKPKKISVTVSK